MMKWCCWLMGVVWVLGVWQGAGGAVASGGADPVGCGPALEFLVSHKVASRDHLARLPDGGECLGAGWDRLWGIWEEYWVWVL